VIKKYFKKRTVGIFLLGLTFLFWTIAIYFFNGESTESNILLFTKNITCIVGLLLVVPSDWFATHVYDNREYEKNETIDELVEKIRYRAVLFNNISVLVFIFTIAVIVAGFWILGRPDTKEQNVDIAVRISASVLLIFLVQILFRLFKYLLRVAAFYNGKADAIEFSNLQKNLPIDKTIDYFTPDRYDISDLESPNFVEVLKAKLGIK
jgi:hypothetical protein